MTAGAWLTVEQIAERAVATKAPAPMPTRVIAIDGCGAAGKTTLASAMAAALGGVPIVHTDDFASWDNPIDWWPRLLEEVLEPLAAGAPPRFRKYDWERMAPGDMVILSNVPQVLILEGVSASRLAFDPYLSFRIWLDATAETRIRRGIARDGEDAEDNWHSWMAAEDEYVEREDPVARADLVLRTDSGSLGRHSYESRSS